MNYEKILKEFVEIERAKVRVGSGDDMFYEQQIIDFVSEQKDFLIEFMKFMKKKLTKQN